MRSREVRLAARPQGPPKESDFELAEVDVPDAAEGEVVIRNELMSVDPYMRGRMNDVRSYVPPFQIGEPLQGGAIGRVVSSGNKDYDEGDWVVSMLGWREIARSDGSGLVKFDAEAAPPSAALGVLGLTGMTAYVGLLDIGQPKEGDTVFVSGAAGAVGSIAGQIAKLKGCRVIGSAGSAEKVAWLRDELGFDVAFDYKETPPREALRDEKIDVYFDNVGGDHLEAAIGAAKPFARFAECGMISHYNDAEPAPGPRNMAMIVGKRLRLQGFILTDHMDRRDAFLADMTQWLGEGKVRHRETIVDGIENAPRALIGCLGGENIGKMLVRVNPAETPETAH
jgi:NADPH-dependent curcumin reductase CurA